MSDARRYSRQTRLPEIGREGQAKLTAASVVVRSSGFAATIEERYVRLAGMLVASDAPSVDADVIDAKAAGVMLGLRHAPAREVAEGALRALVAIGLVVRCS